MSTNGFRFDNSYARLSPFLFARQLPTPVAAPTLLLLNDALVGELGLDAHVLRERGAGWFSGNVPMDGAEPLAQAYAGHQFGHPAMLGDGRCVLLGEQVMPTGRRVDVQLKGAGRTPFSRGGDGRAVLGPMLREYLISEAMAALGIASTRSLAVVTTGESVQRETPLPGAILTRVAASHIRVGTFQYASWHQDKSLLPGLFDYTLQRHYPQLAQADNPALALLDAVMDAQIALVVSWMRVGFIHGVLNTDNVAISGESIDFGPCAFMDSYDPATVFSSIDRQGRYAFGNQPFITHWNLGRLAEALLPLIGEDESRAIADASTLLDSFMPRFDAAWRQMMRAKLGLVGEQDGDAELIADWLALLKSETLDYTNAHLALMQEALPSQSAAMQDWHARWRARFTASGSKELMQANNPVMIARNHLVQQALDAAEQGEMMPFHELLAVLQSPFNKPADERYGQPPSPAEAVCQTFCGT